MSDDENGGLFAIEVSSDEEASTTAAAAAKVPRDFQSEADFQRVKASYRPKVETGDLYKDLNLPIDNPSKPEYQKILHAIEELYFYRRYEDALQTTRDALRGEMGDEFKRVLVDYRERCERKVEKAREGQGRGEEKSE